MITDTHCHLNFKVFNHHVDEVISEANAIGVKKIIIPGANINSSQKAVKLAKNYKNVFAAAGIHPIHSASELENWGISKLENKLLDLAKNKKVVAIGECGLDYYSIKYQVSSIKDNNIPQIKKIQKEIFIMQIKLAKKLNLPLIIHNRNASNDIYKIIIHNSSSIIHCALHCFQGNEKLLNWTIKHKCYIGITGLVSFDKKMQQVVKKTPLKNLLIETDAPFLLPEPLRSQKLFPNKPKNVKIVASWIAKIKGDSFSKVARQTTLNAVQLFKV